VCRFEIFIDIYYIGLLVDNILFTFSKIILKSSTILLTNSFVIIFSQNSEVFVFANLLYSYNLYQF